jgi:CBS domain-containing protein
MPLLRPMLIPGLPRAWRDPNTLQLGHDPARAVLVDLPDPRAAALLDLLDGTRSERAVLSHATAAGVGLGDARELLDTLHEVGLVLPASALLPPTARADLRNRLVAEAAALALGPSSTAAGGMTSGALESAVDRAARAPGGAIGPALVKPAAPTPAPAQILRRRGAARVVVAGRGRLGAGIAVALAQAGVGHVHPDLAGVVTAADLAGSPLRPADIGRSRAEAAAAAVADTCPGTPTHAVRKPEPDLTVQLDHDQPVPLLAAMYGRRRRPHLAVSVREGVAVLGPLVPASGGPCLNCADLYRRERDAGWPARRPSSIEPCAVATVLAATAHAVADVLAFLDGRTPPTLGASIEISAPDRVRRRTWPPHPACGCARA